MALLGAYPPTYPWPPEQRSQLSHHPDALHAVGQAIPYGIYETTRNHGEVVIGDCFDTPRFAVEAISDWWWQDGQRAFPDADRLLVLADAGGSNSCRSRVWKQGCSTLWDAEEVEEVIDAADGSAEAVLGE